MYIINYHMHLCFLCPITQIFTLCDTFLNSDSLKQDHEKDLEAALKLICIKMKTEADQSAGLVRAQLIGKYLHSIKLIIFLLSALLVQ